MRAVLTRVACSAFRVLAALSLLLLGTLLVGWVQSYAWPERDFRFLERPGRPVLHGFSARGQVGFDFTSELPASFPPVTTSYSTTRTVGGVEVEIVTYSAILLSPADLPTSGTRVLGYYCGIGAYTWSMFGFTQRGFFVNAPYVVLVVLAAILPFLATRGWVHRRRKARRARENQCLNCGYDLRATSGRCPECGRAVASAGGLG